MKKRLMMVIGIAGLVITLSGRPSSFAALQYQETYTSAAGAQKVLLMVNSAIYDAIYQPSLVQYIADLEAEDYNVTLTKYISGTPQELKGYIKLFSGLKGVILIGDLPVPWYEIRTETSYDEFPIDLFYMDLDGTWQDADNDGKYDSHTGNLSPEIWVGRLTASPLRSETYWSWEAYAYINFVMDTDEVGLLKNYFAKGHLYRTGKLSIIQRALYYPDDDWSGYGHNLSLAYSNVTVINDKATTNDDDYTNRLKSNYEWIEVAVHSTPKLHLFNNDWWTGEFYFKEVRDADPKTLFYHLFACSASRYTTSNYIGGHYIFTKTNGLAVVGSTKAGSMWASEYFYPHLGPTNRKSIGVAFREWFRSRNLADTNQRDWFYGMALLGDPTLSLDPPIASITSIAPSAISLGESVTFQGSGKITNGGITAYNWRSSINGYLSNQSSFSTTSLSVGTHTIYFKVKDDKGRWSSEDKGTVTVTVKSDTTPPSGTIKINNDAPYTRTTSVTLNLSATDTGGSGLYQMRFSNDNITWSTPEAYATTKNWTLTSGNGTRTVYAKFSDKAGNWSNAVSDTIILDTTKPTISYISDYPDPFNPEAGQYTKISYTLGDNLSNYLYVYVYIYNSAGSLVRQLGQYAQYLGRNSVTWNGRNSSGYYVPNGIYKYRIRAQDRAGNYIYSSYYYVTKKGIFKIGY